MHGQLQPLPTTPLYKRVSSSHNSLLILALSWIEYYCLKHRKMSPTVGFVAFFALLAFSQAAPSAMVNINDLIDAAEQNAKASQACVNVNAPAGVVVRACPTPDGCFRVQVIVSPFVNVDVVACRRNGRKYNNTSFMCYFLLFIIFRALLH